MCSLTWGSLGIEGLMGVCRGSSFTEHRSGLYFWDNFPYVIYARTCYVSDCMASVPLDLCITYSLITDNVLRNMRRNKQRRDMTREG